MRIENPQKTMYQSIYEACSFHAYEKTIHFQDIDIATDQDYQKNFNFYYRVRRDADWLKEYYAYFNAHKNDKTITFADILRHISNVAHTVKKTAKNPEGIAKTVDASYASKMLATIRPDHPVWDSQVLRYLKISVSDQLSHEEKIEECIRVYEEIHQKIANYLQTEEGKQCIAEFDRVFPNTGFSDYKKIDFYLWNLGK